MRLALQSYAWLTALSLAVALARSAGAQDPASGGASETVPQPATAKAETPSDEYYELMRVFVDTFEQIDRNYVKDVDRRELIEAAVHGMLSKLDPYSDYYNPTELPHFQEEIEQEFGGVGIQVHWDAEHREILVMTPLPGSPAYAAGIRAGDRIIEIEGKPVREFPEGREIQQAVDLLKGEPGVEVAVTIRHPTSNEPEKVTLKRAIIQLDTVLGDTRNPDGTWNFLLDGQDRIGYIRLTHFTKRSAEELRSALQALRDQELRGLVLDLRYNPGGLLQAAVEISDLFVESGVIVSTEGRNSHERKWYAKKFGTYSGFPMAILVNHFSASASEIVSACLQDHNRAIVVGERSWGKGSVQNVIELEGGDSALKLTTASYHRPSGKNIHRFPGATDADEWGVKPNDGFEVKFSLEQAVKYQEYRRDRDLPPSDGAAPTEFSDSQLDKAIEAIAQQLAGNAAEPKAADAPEGADSGKNDPAT
jgi:carboxyl-terminal processing protease